MTEHDPAMGPLRSFGINLFAHLRTRLQLLGVEVAEEKRRLIEIIAVCLVSHLFVCLTGFMVLLLLAGIYWDTPQRLTAIASITAVVLLIAIASVIWLLNQLKQPTRLFKSSIAELQIDEDLLRRHDPGTAEFDPAADKAL